MSEIHIAKKRKSSQNTSPAQFERYLQEMENDYVFRSNTINPTLDQDYLVKKWAMLRHDLNSMGTRLELSVEEWKKRFQEWKYSIKKKSRLITEDLHKTGGGPKLNIQMTPLEERGLNVFGKVTVVGTKDVTPYVGLVLPHTVVATCSSEAEGVIVLEDNINITEPEIIITNNSYSNRVKPLSDLAKNLLETSESANSINTSINDTLKVFCEEYINLKKEKLRIEIAKFKFLNKDFDFE